MRILLLNWQDRLNPQAGGAEIHLHEVFGRLARDGHQVTLLTSGWPGAPEREMVDGMEVLRVGARLTYGVAAPRFYRESLRHARFDVVVEALNKVPLFSPAWAPGPVVLLVHHLFGTTAFREASVPVAAATWLMERPLGRVYRGVPTQVISQSTATDLVRRGLRREDIRVIHPGVDLEFYHPDPATPRTPDPTFLYLGRLKRYKGIDTAVRAIGILRDEGHVARLRIAGRGDWEGSLRDLVRRMDLGDLVRFEGFVDDDTKRTLLRCAWANVFPSPKEGWGITNVEAAACGTPSVASDAPGLRESVEHGTTGLLVPHGDVAALARALGSLAGDRLRVDALGSGARVFAERLSWDRTAQETEEHLAACAVDRVRIPVAGRPG